MSARRTAALALSAALMGGGLVAVSAPADAANPRCVSRAEYRRIHNGQTPAKVARIVGAPGRVASSTSYAGYRSVIREYRACTRYGVAFVSFSADPGKALKVEGKSVAW